MTAADWDKMTPEQADRLLRAIYDPQFESREAFRHMNKVLDEHKAGRASYKEYADAFAEFERAAQGRRVDGVRVTCTASGKTRSCVGNPDGEDWTGNRDDEIICCDCGGIAKVWVRGTDLWPRAKIRAHKAPEGVSPAPFRFGPTGYVAAPERSSAG